MKNILLLSLILVSSTSFAGRKELFCKVSRVNFVAFAILFSKQGPSDVIRFRTTNFEGDPTPNSNTTAHPNACSIKNDRIICRVPNYALTTATISFDQDYFRNLQKSRLSIDPDGFNRNSREAMITTTFSDDGQGACIWINELASHRKMIESIR